jgi:hypothetical protein
MRALAVILALAGAVGCSANPCADAGPTDVCVILTVTSDNGYIRSVQQLNVAATVDGNTVGMHRSPTVPMSYSLPFDIGLIFPGSDAYHDVSLRVDGVTAGSFSAEGTVNFTLSGGPRQRETVALDGAPALPDMTMAPPPPDMAMPADMAMLVTTPLVLDSFDNVVSSDNLIAAITHSDQTLRIYNTSGNLQVALDKGTSVNALYVSDNIVVYCVNFVAIGTTGKQSCTLKMWKPGSANATTLGSGVYPFAASFSSDGNTIVWRQNIDTATATKADIMASIGGTQTPLATALPLNVSWFSASTNLVFATVFGTTAGQFDVARLTTGAAAVHICQNCDQVILSSDETMVAARAAVSGSFGKVAVGAVSINTVNGLTATTFPNSDVSRLVDYYPGQVSYLSAGASSNSLVVYATGPNTVTTRDTSIQSIWFTTADMVAFSSRALGSDGTGDLWLVSKSSGSDQLFSAGPGIPWDYSSDDYYTFNEQPAGGANAAFVNAGHGVSSTSLFTLKAPTSDGVFLDVNTVVCFRGTNKMLIEYPNINQGFLFNSTVVDYDVDVAKKRVLFVIQNGMSGDGIYQYNY